MSKLYYLNVSVELPADLPAIHKNAISWLVDNCSDIRGRSAVNFPDHEFFRYFVTQHRSPFDHYDGPSAPLGVEAPDHHFERDEKGQAKMHCIVHQDLLMVLSSVNWDKRLLVLAAEYLVSIGARGYIDVVDGERQHKSLLDYEGSFPRSVFLNSEA